MPRHFNPAARAARASAPRRPGSPTISAGTNGLPRGLGLTNGQLTYRPPAGAPRPGAPTRGVTNPGFKGGWNKASADRARAAGLTTSSLGGNWGANRLVGPSGAAAGGPRGAAAGAAGSLPWSPGMPTMPRGSAPKLPKHPSYSKAPGALTADQQAYIDETLGNAQHQFTEATIEGDRQSGRIKANHVIATGELNRGIVGARRQAAASLADRGLALSERFAGGAKAQITSQQTLGAAQLDKGRAEQLADTAERVSQFQRQLDLARAQLEKREAAWRSENKSRQLRGIGL
jgi:hypothetical protein